MSWNPRLRAEEGYCTVARLDDEKDKRSVASLSQLATCDPHDASSHFFFSRETDEDTSLAGVRVAWDGRDGQARGVERGRARDVEGGQRRLAPRGQLHVPSPRPVRAVQDRVRLHDAGEHDIPEEVRRRKCRWRARVYRRQPVRCSQGAWRKGIAIVARHVCVVLTICPNRPR